VPKDFALVTLIALLSITAILVLGRVCAQKAP
jgi:hypothetical protein